MPQRVYRSLQKADEMFGFDLIDIVLSMGTMGLCISFDVPVLYTFLLSGTILFGLKMIKKGKPSYYLEAVILSSCWLGTFVADRVQCYYEYMDKWHKKIYEEYEDEFHGLDDEENNND